ncbi:MAG: RusA family crossover junction endodeoxyribonuclease [Succinatimonas sp.]|jgi:Holliday junction resolvase RusA-like endonuclease|nr:RusA family crossover junction endodeoxyribonuclease [Succinatimonas sp.]
MVLIDLTLPPSANQRLIPYVINMTRRIIGIKDSPKYREWMELEARKIKNEIQAPYAEPVYVYMEITFPDRRKRDLDNMAKPVCDVLKLAGIYDDDSLIEFLICRRLSPNKKLAGIRVGVWTVSEHNSLSDWSLENAD